jgi:uncharacterized protein YpmB
MSGDAIGEKKYTTFIIMIVLIVVVCIAGSIFYAIWKKKHDEKEKALEAEKEISADE